MAEADHVIHGDDPFDLGRFTRAQERTYDTALAELRSGQKRTHWMWYIFPQIDGLGHSAASKYYAIKSLEEARQYLNHPILGPRLVECTEAVLATEGRSVAEIFGHPDDRKFLSCMTLFACVTDSRSVFVRALDKCFLGRRDLKTLHLLEELERTDEQKVS